MKTIEFIFDFGSPNAYLSWKVLPAVTDRTGAKIVLVPCLLGGIFNLTNNRSPMAAYAEVKGKLAYQQLETRRFVAKHALSAFRMNPHFPVNTLTVMRGLVAAQRAGVEQAYVQAVQTAMWETGEKVDDPEIIKNVLDAAGLDGASLLAVTGDPAVKDELKASTESAVARGVFGIPTFFVEGEMFFGKNTLEQVEEAAGGQR